MFCWFGESINPVKDLESRKIPTLMMDSQFRNQFLASEDLEQDKKIFQRLESRSRKSCQNGGHLIPQKEHVTDSRYTLCPLCEAI